MKRRSDQATKRRRGAGPLATPPRTDAVPLIARSSFLIPRFGRRANALIMAVTMTAMLAIIGASFVLVTRIERQTVRSFGNTQGLDDVQNAVINRIQSILAADVVTQSGTLGINILSSHLPNGSPNAAYEPYDAPVGSGLVGDPWLASIEPVDTAGGVSGGLRWPRLSDVFNLSALSTAEAQVWNGSVPARDGEPADADGDGITDSVWRNISSLVPMPDKNVFAAVRVIDNCGLLNVNSAWGLAGEPFLDKNGDGVWNAGETFWNINGNKDANNAPVYDGPAGEAGYGNLPIQTDPRAILNLVDYNNDVGRPAPTDDDKANWLYYLYATRLGRLYGLSAMFASASPFYPFGWPAERTYAYQMLRFMENPGASAYNGVNVGGVRFFGLDDEMELRHRFCLNTAFESSLESAWWPILGYHDPAAPTLYFRAASYTDAIDANGQKDDESNLANWWYAITGNRLKRADNSAAVTSKSYRDVRHLLTAYSFDRTLRPPIPTAIENVLKLNELSDQDAARANLGKILGPFRQADVQRLVDVLMHTPVNSSSHILAGRKLISLLLYAGRNDAAPTKSLTVDEAVQWMANLRDYLDAGDVFRDAGNAPVPNTSSLTHYPKNHFQLINGVEAPSVAIFGFEQQPFISEVYAIVKREKDAEGNEATTVVSSAVELCNPYPNRLRLFGWKLQGATTADVSLDGYTIPPAGEYQDGQWRPGRLVIVSDAGVPVAAAETFNIPDTNPQETTVVTVTAAGFQFKSGDTGLTLKLVRPVPTPEFGVLAVVDTVASTVMDPLRGLGGNPPTLNGPAVAYSAQRGTRKWRFTRNAFCLPNDATASAPGLGLWIDKPHAANYVACPPAVPPGDEAAPGLPLPVANRYAVDPATLVVPAATAIEVGGWYELTRPPLVGNREATADEAITTAIHTKYLPGNGVDAEPTAEAAVRFDLADSAGNDSGDRARKLFEVLGFFARCDDAVDNENPALGVYGAERLAECRTPSRINVNTAPEAVLRAVIPPLNLTPSLQALYATELAAAIVQDRTANGPFLNLANFFRRVDAYQRVKNDALRPEDKYLSGNVPRYYRLSRWLGVQKAIARADTNKPYDPATDDYDLGSADIKGDYEDRDWVLGRIANVLTVRSDTFTAYILLRLQSAANPAERTDRRLIALFDRSNVFLPPALARNGPLVYVDNNLPNGRWDAGEPWNDANNNGIADPGEYTDLNGNGKWDGEWWGESWFNDMDNDGAADPGEFVDLNGNNTWDPPSRLLDDSGDLVRIDPFLRTFRPGRVNDPDYFDRQYVTPKVVAVKVVGGE